MCSKCNNLYSKCDALCSKCDTEIFTRCRVMPKGSISIVNKDNVCPAHWNIMPEPLLIQQFGIEHSQSGSKHITKTSNHDGVTPAGVSQHVSTKVNALCSKRDTQNSKRDGLCSKHDQHAQGGFRYTPLQQFCKFSLPQVCIQAKRTRISSRGVHSTIQSSNLLLHHVPGASPFLKWRNVTSMAKRDICVQ